MHAVYSHALPQQLGPRRELKKPLPFLENLRLLVLEAVLALQERKAIARKGVTWRRAPHQYKPVYILLL